MNDATDNKRPQRLSLKEAFDRAAASAEKDPPWLKAIYAQNREITRGGRHWRCAECGERAYPASPTDHSELYAVMDGRRSMKAAWLDLLPPAVLRVALEDYAARIGYELRPAAVLCDEHDASAHATSLVHEALDAIRTMTATQADGEIDRAEAIEELRQWDELDDVKRERVALLRKVEREGAVSLRTVKAAK